MAKRQKRWVYVSLNPKQIRPVVPEALKTEVTTKPNELIDTVLKPKG